MKETRFFITGATGFYGKWLLESIATANDQLGMGIRATLLSRNPRYFTSEVPHLAARSEFDWLIGDTATFDFPRESYDYVLHFATPPAAQLGAGNIGLILENLEGTGRVLEFARQAGVKRLLYASSGAVYGKQPSDMAQIPEDYRGAPDPASPSSAYGEVKRTAELLCALSDTNCVIARGFAFVGPFLPLTDKFAIGSFIHDALGDGPIRINGDGSPVRSYLYAADLAIWLITLLLQGKSNHPYNVGSDQAISLVDLAQSISVTTGGPKIEIARASNATPAERYIPSIQRARDELGLDVFVPFTQALERTVDWARQGKAG